MYPMKMKPVFKDYLWGGEQLITLYGKNTDIRPLAESWEISCHPDGLSVIENGIYSGQTLSKVLSEHPAYVGAHYNPEKGFPILIKLIDAKQSLSLQVHPDDIGALRLEGYRQGKNELWYIVDALPDAKLIVGFSRPASKKEIRARIQNHTILEIVREIPVKAGDCFPIPAGMIHAIGAGTVVAEVQQSSNITYRVYDFDRQDVYGNYRELHIDKALEVIDTTLQARNSSQVSAVLRNGYIERQVLDWEWFHTSVFKIDASARIQCEESFTGLICVNGMVDVTANNTTVTLQTGESAFLPAGMGSYILSGGGEILSTTCRIT